jgi:phytoene desaturase
VRALVVGAGFAGLAASVELAARGARVRVVERLPYPGGRSGRFDTAGYRIDTGPTVFTMRPQFEAIFARAGRDPGDYISFARLEPAYRAAFSDGRDPEGDGVIRVHADPEAMAAEIERTCSRADAEGYLRLRRHLEELFAVEYPSFIDAQLDGIGSMLARLPALARLARLGGFARLPRLVNRYLRDPRLARLFSFQALYAGLAPAKALGLFAIIAYMDTMLGVYQPVGGMRAAVDALAHLAEDLGAEFCYGVEVEAIERHGDRVTRLITTAGPMEADVVISTLDPGAQAAMLGRSRRRRLGIPWRLSPSCYLSLRGVRGAIPEGLAHHNIFFGLEWHGAFRDLVDEGRLMRDPSTLVSIPTRSDPALAPPGGHVLYVLEPVPHLEGQVDWDADRAWVAERLEDRLTALGLAGDGLTTEARLDLAPPEWRAMGMDGGTPFSLAHTFFQSGPFRVPNRDPCLRNLFLAGSGTIPGVGVPLVLVSGRLAAERAWGLAGEH